MLAPPLAPRPSVKRPSDRIGTKRTMTGIMLDQRPLQPCRAGAGGGTTTTTALQQHLGLLRLHLRFRPAAPRHPRRLCPLPSEPWPRQRRSRR